MNWISEGLIIGCITYCITTLLSEIRDCIKGYLDRKPSSNSKTVSSDTWYANRSPDRADNATSGGDHQFWINKKDNKYFVREFPSKEWRELIYKEQE